MNRRALSVGFERAAEPAWSVAAFATVPGTTVLQTAVIRTDANPRPFFAIRCTDAFDGLVSEIRLMEDGRRPARGMVDALRAGELPSPRHVDRVCRGAPPTPRSRCGRSSARRCRSSPRRCCPCRTAPSGSASRSGPERELPAHHGVDHAVPRTARDTVERYDPHVHVEGRAVDELPRRRRDARRGPVGDLPAAGRRASASRGEAARGGGAARGYGTGIAWYSHVPLSRVFTTPTWSPIVKPSKTAHDGSMLPPVTNWTEPPGFTLKLGTIVSPK